VKSDQLVTPKDLLQAMAELKRLGARRVMEELEEREPDLAEVTLEEVTAIHHELLALGAAPKRAGRVYRRVEALVLVAALAMRQAYARLVTEESDGTGAAHGRQSAVGDSRRDSGEDATRAGVIRRSDPDEPPQRG
jgi:hypothetical protein